MTRPESATPPLPVGQHGWDETTSWIRDGQGPQRLDRLINVAEQLRRRTSSAGGRTDDIWQLLELSIRRADLPPTISGLCSGTAAGPRSVVVNRNDDRRRQNFTIAHELGHLLLGPNPTSAESVEPWCDRFAARLLCSPTDLRSALGGTDAITPKAVRGAAARLGLSLSATVVALGSVALPHDTAVMLIRCYQHNNQAAEAPRVAVAASKTVFIPADRRLRRIGLTSLADYADVVHAHGVRAEATETLVTPLEAAPDRATGRDHLTAVRAVVDGTRRAAQGPAQWTAIAGGRNDLRYVIAVMTFDLAADTTLRSRRTSAETTKAAVGYPGQMRLDQPR